MFLFGDILAEPVKMQVNKIILVHNHPSGSLRPSKEDSDITNKIKRACELLNIRLIDHVIVTDANYYSFHDNGVI